MATTWRNCASFSISACEGVSAENPAARLRIAQPTALFLDRQAEQLSIARPHRERVESGADAHHNADRPARHLRRDRQALRAQLVDRFDDAAPALRVVVAVGEQEPDRPAGFARLLANPAQLELLIVEIAVHAERAGAGHAQSRADAEQLMVVGIARGDEFAGRRLVRIGARSGEAERARAQRFDGQLAHLGDIVGRRRLAGDGAVAHHIDASRQVRGLRANIDRSRPPLQFIHELRKRLPFPAQPGGQHRIGNFLDALHQIHQRAAMLFLHRRKADAAIAEHHRGDAVPARGRDQRVPHRLAVVMGVHVDPAGRDQEARGVDLALAGALLAADAGDASARDRHIPGEWRLAGAVDNGAAANDDVVHGSRSWAL